MTGLIHDNAMSMIGNTSMVDFTSLCNRKDIKLLAKCEFQNPTLSIKDRIVKHMLTKAEQNGDITPGKTVIVTASSGNTAASTAMICSVMGYKSVIITNTKCSQEKMDLTRAFGGELIVTVSGVAHDDPKHYMNMEIAICKERENHYALDQYESLNNPEAYYLTLAPEIYAQTGGAVTHFVAAASTGGTISGVSKYMKEQSKDITCICPDPMGSVFHEYFYNKTIPKMKSFEIEGVGKDSIPGAMSFDHIDKVMQISDQEALTMCHRVAKEKGILIGGSSGLNVAAAVKMAEELPADSVLVLVLPDSGAKYLSKFYNNDWLSSKGFNTM